MKTTGNEEGKPIKLALVQELSSSVKNLHYEFDQNYMHNNTIQSDADTAQCFISVLEAAFIHGLKDAYVDKSKRSKDLPQPQFWNLICKISHKDAIQQIRKLNFIRSQVGFCRAWLRIALNEAALSSYLSSLVNTSEYKTFLNRYYKTYALFRDHEQCDIFLRHLRGIETLRFELGCNSPILNSWTRTPLELAGLVSVNRKKKLLLQNGTSHSTKPQGLTSASSLSQLQSSGSSHHSRQGSLTNSIQILSSSPAFSVTSQTSGSLNSIYKLTGTEPVNNLVEINPDIGLSFDVNDGSSKPTDSVLYSRHLAIRKSHKRRKKLLNDDLLSSSSRCSSMSSLSSGASAGVVGAGQYESIAAQESRKNSSENGDPTFQDYNLESNWSVADGKKQSQSTSNGLIDHKAYKDATQNEEQASSPSSRPSNLPYLSSSPHPNVDEKNSEITATPNSHHKKEEIEANESIFSEESIDIYAIPPSETTVDAGLETITETVAEVTTPLSPGYGNSLLCSVGWSSDTTSHKDSHNPTPVVESTPMRHSPSRNNGGPQIGESVSPISNAVFSRREGYLKKKGELLFWRIRWFVLSTDTLAYFKDRNDNEELDILHLVDVKDINKSDMSKNNSICLKMVNGDEHLLSADSHKLIEDWTNDIEKAVDDIRANPSAYCLDSVENTYDVLEAVDADLDNQLTDSTGNTSWFASMKSHMTRIANEKGLDAQNYQCADCASPIGMIMGLPRVCSYTGLYYCSYCHHNDEHIIPSRMVHNWDFRKHKVSKGSKKFLLEMWKEPCIDLNRVNPLAYRHIDELEKLYHLRVKLTALRPYITTCRLLPVGSLPSKLRGHFYMLEHLHVYSACDLHKAFNHELHDVISKAVTFGIEHVTSCPLCSSKGFICEICRRNEIIFAFQTQTTTQCEECKSVYHMECLPDLAKCPKCARRDRRLKEQSQPINEEEIVT